MRAAHTLAVAAIGALLTLTTPFTGPSAARGEPSPSANAEPVFPDTPEGRCAAAFVECWAAPSTDAWEAFEREFASSSRLASAGPASRAVRLDGLRARFGDLEIGGVDIAADGAVTINASTGNVPSVSFSFLMSGTEPGKLEGIRIMSGPGAGVSAPITPEERASSVEGVASAVEEGYVFPEVGKRMADALRAALAAGEYDSVDRSVELAQRLTEDLRGISNDRHLGVRPAPPPAPDAEARLAIPGEGGRGNYGFRRAEILDGNVGYIRLDGFVPGPEAEKTAAAAMAFVRNTDALVFDLRWNGGGSPEMIRFLTSYLFDTRTHLNDMVDRAGEVVEEYWTLDEVPGERLDPELPVYVLTSSFTFSGAEEFSYNLKNLGRATIVGETTGGGAHPVRAVRASDRLMVGVPFMRARNPISGTNWEGTGVEPDVAASSDEALERALELARRGA